MYANTAPTDNETKLFSLNPIINAAFHYPSAFLFYFLRLSKFGVYPLNAKFYVILRLPIDLGCGNSALF